MEMFLKSGNLMSGNILHFKEREHVQSFLTTGRNRTTPGIPGLA